MICKEYIQELVEKITTGTEIFIVDIVIKPVNKISVLIDSNNGVNIDNCANVSRFIGKRLNREEEDFQLEVSSPGLDSSFKVLQQYKKNIGREVEILEENGIKKTGILLAVTKEGIEIEEVKKDSIKRKNKKQIVKNKVKFDFNHIKSTKVIPALFTLNKR